MNWCALKGHFIWISYFSKGLFWTQTSCFTSSSRFWSRLKGQGNALVKIGTRNTYQSRRKLLFSKATGNWKRKPLLTVHFPVLENDLPSLIQWHVFRELEWGIIYRWYFFQQNYCAFKFNLINHRTFDHK